MKRKVVKHGPSTLIVSLPVKWTKNNGINPGDELEVDEVGKKLIVSTESTAETRTIEIDITKMDRTSIVLQIRDLYRKGYSEIKVNFDEHQAYHYRTDKSINTISIIHSEVNRLIGMEIISQKHNHCEIKELTESSGKEFNNILRKVFLQLNDTFDDVILALEEKNFSELSTIEEQHDTLTNFISYCMRLINQGKIDNTEDGPHLYQLLISVELIVDILKYFCRSVIRKKYIFKQANIEIIKNIAELVKTYSKLQFNFKKEIMQELPKKRDIVKKEIEKQLSRKESINDLVYINYLAPIDEIVRSMVVIAMTLQN
jgi:phosphate uptake regulator